MPFVKNALDILVEAAGVDLQSNQQQVIKESNIMSSYRAIPEASHPIIYGPEVVPIVEMDGGYYTEMNFLYPFMETNGIKSIDEALKYVAESNNVQDVGIFVMSESDVSECIQNAFNEGGQKKKETALDKFAKVVGLKNSLITKNGKKKIMRKKSGKKCPACNHYPCICK